MFVFENLSVLIERLGGIKAHRKASLGLELAVPIASAYVRPPSLVDRMHLNFIKLTRINSV
jgi:hypothetical protein